jgi:hypothetical protein
MNCDADRWLCECRFSGERCNVAEHCKHKQQACSVSLEGVHYTQTLSYLRTLHRVACEDGYM